jgi:hypothetical protein
VLLGYPGCRYSKSVSHHANCQLVGVATAGDAEPKRCNVGSWGRFQFRHHDNAVPSTLSIAVVQESLEGDDRKWSAHEQNGAFDPERTSGRIIKS